MDTQNNADEFLRPAWVIERERLQRKGVMLETALAAFDPILFGKDALAAHMSASPRTVEAAQRPIREAMRSALTAIRVLPRIAQHTSDCAVFNEPAKPNGPCDCGASLAPSLDQDEKR